MTRIIAITNQKGGVGKSTTAHALGAGLAQRGLRVLWVDLDPQGNLTYTTGAEDGRRTAFDILTQRAAAGEAIQKTKIEGAHIIPASPFLSNADAVLSATGKEYRLREALEAVAGEYDYIIIDTPPALGILTVNALTAAGELIIPAQADIYSLQGIGQLMETLQAVKTYCNPSIMLGGILLTRYSGRAVLSRDMAGLLENTAEMMGTQVFNTVIREGIAIKEAQALRQDVFSYAPKSNAAADYNAFIDELIGGTSHNE